MTTAILVVVAVIGVVWFVLTGARWLDRYEDDLERRENDREV